jgi:hypothetical protein
MNTRIAALSNKDIDDILRLEESCFTSCLRASRETLSRRFDLGHIMLGLYEDDHLIGVASFAYKWFDSKEKTKVFAKEQWRPFYQMKMSDTYNTVLIYNVELLPSKRGVQQIYTLLNAMMKRAADDGCEFLIGISRIPSYNGDPYNHIAIKPELKSAIDQYLSGGPIPSNKTLLQDPLILLYRQIGNCEVLTLASNYLPEDIPSGGVRAIVYTKLEGQWETNMRKHK